MKNIFAVALMMFSLSAFASAFVCNGSEDLSEDDVSIILSVRGNIKEEVVLKEPCDSMGVLSEQDYKDVRSVSEEVKGAKL